MKRDKIILSRASECVSRQGDHPPVETGEQIQAERSDGQSVGARLIAPWDGAGWPCDTVPHHPVGAINRAPTPPVLASLDRPFSGSTTCGSLSGGHSPTLIASSIASKNAKYLRETNPSTPLYETDMARRWWALSRDVRLPLSNGTTCQLRFPGRPGGAMGPDVRDAVLLFVHNGKPLAKPVCTSYLDGKQVAGDIEFHIRSSDWFAHAHHTDARYNNVILHVVLIYDDVTSIQRQDGITIPTCSLNDLPPAAYDPPVWPCRQVIADKSEEERVRLLNFAGLLRFEQKTQAFLTLLRKAQPHGSFNAYDTCLVTALAEGLGYGRDRAFFRAAGLHLLDMMSKGDIPEPLGHTGEPSPLDASRLRVLGNLVQQWRVNGAWETLRNALLPGCQDGPQLIQRIRAVFEGLSTARADILVCNIVLPFASAVALLENDMYLAEQAESLYVRYPRLSSNTITRTMCNQLQLGREPRSACQQQGLHYIYASTCREKQCTQCIAGKYEWRKI